MANLKWANKGRAAAVQRKEPVEAIGRTHAERQQADHHLSSWRHLERRRTVAQRPIAWPTAVSRRERPVPADAAGSDRPRSELGHRELKAQYRPINTQAERNRLNR